ncbi:hypothetical protein G7Y89_g2355 [Cudoniella acicularis]|uniref:Uncharacterized protein n=1 Tax=Cudoniella acicularis TaxID=354080 RepID=A0A8H4RWF9_9HELO|nr:hypothetical protein G7Y89_g2355 [Cudoniella acicularis]
MKLHDLYASQMVNHPYGYALYKPASTKVLRPGAVGYWNELGEWQPIAWLDDPVSLKKLNLKVPEEELERARDDPPPNPSTEMATTTRALFDDGCKITWIFLGIVDEVRRLRMGLNASAADGLGIETEVGWFLGTSSSGWNDYSSKAADEEVVVFASGFHFKIRQIFGMVIHVHSELLSSRGSNRAGEQSIDGTRREINMKIPSAVRGDVDFEVNFAPFGLSPPEPPLVEDNESDIE